MKRFSICLVLILLAAGTSEARRRKKRHHAPPPAAAQPVSATPPPAPVNRPDAETLLELYDQKMGPTNFEWDCVMTSTREDGSTRSYTVRVLKRGLDSFRASFDAPASVKGQEMLRRGDNLWVYMPNLKRAIRIASRDSFQGGDFNNADVLRANYSADYDVRMAGWEDNLAHLLLTGKSQDVAYDHIELWLRADGLPVKGKYYATGGKLLRTAAFSDYEDFGGTQRPALVVMRNALVPSRHSELHTTGFKVLDEIPATRFVLDDLGR